MEICLFFGCHYPRSPPESALGLMGFPTSYDSPRFWGGAGVSEPLFDWERAAPNLNSLFRFLPLLQLRLNLSHFQTKKIHTWEFEMILNYILEPLKFANGDLEHFQLRKELKMFQIAIQILCGVFYSAFSARAAL